MLIPAILRKNELLQEFQKLQYTDYLMYEVGSCDNYMPNIEDEPSKETYQYAIINAREELVGYISYQIDWYSSQANNFGLMSFDRGNALIGKEIFNVMTNLIENLKLHRIEWYMVGGNPVERSYDKFCKKYNGRKIVLRDVFKDRYGKYHDSITYEIIREEV
ncbi:GNAT family N-acetyltransferase [Lachnospiraceae bacterium LCP25S3_G4]